MSSSVSPGDSEGWGTILITNTDTVATWGNNQKTRILLVTSQLERDRKYVQTVLAKESKTNKIIFDYFEEKHKKGDVQDEDIFLDKFKKFAPTTVIQNPPGNADEVLHSHKYFEINENDSNILFKNSTCLFLKTQNVWSTDNKWNREECILTSMAPVSKFGLKKQLEKAREDGILENSSDTRILIISGGHGGPYKNGRITPAEGKSCFTKMESLEYGFYKEDCEMIGILPTPDICQYQDQKDKNKVTDVDQTRIKPSPGNSELDKNARALNKDPLFDEITFDILNIAHYGAYNDKNLDNIKSLVAYLEDFKPTFIAIAWCFSSSGDLAIALRSQGFFSKLFLEHDMRKITKDPKAKLSDQQLNILKKAALGLDGTIQYKDFHLAGSSGVGKTELCVEISKMKLAQLRQQGKVDLLVMTQKSEYQTPKALLRKLKRDMEELAIACETWPTFRLMQAEECKTVEDLFNLLQDYCTKKKKEEDTHKPIWTIQNWNSTLPTDSTSNIVVLLDEIKISETGDGEVMIRDVSRLQDLGDNIHTIFCHSPLTGSRSNNVQFQIKLPTTKLGKVYSEQLEIRYRNNKRILEFLNFLASNRVEISYQTTKTYSVDEPDPGFSLSGFRFLKNSSITESGMGTPHDGFLSGTNDRLAASLPITLGGSPHPVLWVDCAWDWEKMDQRLSRYMMNSLVPDMAAWKHRSGQNVSGMVIYGQTKRIWYSSDEERKQTWMCLSRENCAGLEADVVITVGNVFHYEPIARARQQIIVLTGIDTDHRIKSCLEKAKNKSVLAKRNLAEKPDCIEIMPDKSNRQLFPLDLLETNYDVNRPTT